MHLRPYQSLAVEMLRAAHAQRPILVLPTGAGKTVVAHAIVDGAVAKGRRVLIVAHTRQIIEQTARRFGAPMWMAEHHGEGPIVVASIQTIAKRGAPPHDILIVDEAHHACAATYRALVTSAPTVIGLTATPMRLDGRGLGDIGFKAIVEPTSVRALIDAGYLMEPRMFSMPFDRSGLRKRHGEYTVASSEEATKALSGNVVEHWLKYGPGRVGVAFAVSVEHARDLAERLDRAGARVEAVSGRDSSERRTDVLRRLERRDLDIVVNCQLYGEGWDMPSLDLAILARPTASLTVYRQQVGRVMRPAPGKERPIVLDHAGNVNLHGMVTDPVEWSLEGTPKRKSETLVKGCPQCYAMVPVGCATCPECGYVFVEDKRDPPKETTDELVEVQPIDKAQAYVHLLAEAWQRGYRIGWARHRFKSRFSAWPSMRALERKHFPCTGHLYESTKWGQRCRWCGRSPDPAGNTASAW